MTSQSIQQHPASVDAYIRHGWKLVPIPPGTKGPRAVGWNEPGATLNSQFELPHGYGIGLAHAYSGTMAFDIDNWDASLQIMREAGIDLAALYAAPDAVIVDSGRAGRGKLLYQMPPGVTLPSKKIIVDHQTIYELRCATSSMKTVQDVLPPSIHPETKQPYRWAGNGHWTRLPMIPDALLALWQGMLTHDKQNVIPVKDNAHASWDEIRQAVEKIDPGCSRQEWITVGMALHWAGTQTNQPDQGLMLWNEWSQGSDKYPGETGIYQQWVSFKPDKANSVKLGSLFHIATQYGWKRPDPDVSYLFKNTDSTLMLLSWKPKPPSMDLSLWPSELAAMAKEVSVSIGCDPLVPLWAGLAAVCGVVDAQTRLELMPGFKVPPVLWLMTLGDPADKKTPGAQPMLETLVEFEMEDRPRYYKEILDWEVKERIFNDTKKAYIEESVNVEKMMGDVGPTAPAELPPRPEPLKITVSDVTSQKLVRVAAQQPRGVLCYLDEMAGWVIKLSDPKRGDDRSAWVVSYESKRYEMDRVGGGLVVADNLAVSIFGNIQPDVLSANLKSMTSDGLLQRFIPAVLNPANTRLSDPYALKDSTKRAWASLLRLVYSLPKQTYRMSFGAYMEYREFQAWYEESKVNERLIQSTNEFMTAYGKLEGTVGRLILIFHMMENPFSPYVEPDIVRRVVAMVKGYLIHAYRYVLGDIAGNTRFEKWVSDYVIQHSDEPIVTLPQIRSGARRILDKLNVNSWTADRMILAAMASLELANWVKKLDDGSDEIRGQATWAINPAIVEDFREHRKKVILAKQKIMDEIYERQPVSVPKTIVHGAEDYQ